MKINPQVKLGIVGAVFFLAVILSSMFFGKSGVEVLETDVLSWADAAEKCKAKFKSQRSAGGINISNCKKRLWDDEYFYFYWGKPLAIFIENANGKQVAYSGTCQVSRTTGDIVSMTLNKKSLLGKPKE